MDIEATCHIVPVNGVIQAIKHPNALYVRYRIFVLNNKDVLEF